MRTFRFRVSEEFLRSIMHMPTTSEIISVAPLNYRGTNRPMDFEFYAIDTAVPDKEPGESGSGISTPVTPIIHRIEWDWNIQEE